MRKTAKPAPALPPKYSELTSAEAFKLLRRLDVWAGGQTDKTSNPHYDVREALARHVLRELESK